MNLRDYWIRIQEIIFRKQLLCYWIKDGNRLRYFKPSDIVRVESDGPYCVLFTPNQKMQLFTSMAIVEKTLSGWGFIRVSRKSIINVTHVSEINCSQRCYILLDDGSKIIVPRRTKVRTIRRIKKMQV